MKTVGFPLNVKENEHRQALTLEDIIQMSNQDQLYFEEGYGKSFAVTDQMLVNLGVHIVQRKEVLQQDIICDPKAGDSDYLEILQNGQTLFGWIHAVQNKQLTDILLKHHITAIAWEDMFKNGRHTFWRNNEIAGEAAIMQAFIKFGKMPYDTKVAILGRGNVSRGAYKILTGLGADVTVYDQKTELAFKKDIEQYDVIVNAIYWDITRNDHIIYRDDLERMKRDSMIIDISCDEGMGIETCKPTTISRPTYYVDGVLHYAVDHTPSIFYKTATKSISSKVIKYLPIIMKEQETNNDVLNDATIIKDGHILDNKIMNHQKRPETV